MFFLSKVSSLRILFSSFVVFLLITGCGESDSEHIGNHLPDVNIIENDKTVNIGTKINLTATAFDVDVSDILSLKWSFTSKPTGSQSTIVTNQATKLKASFTADKEGKYSVKLVAKDNVGGTGSDTVTITAKKEGSNPPVSQVITSCSQLKGANLGEEYMGTDNLTFINKDEGWLTVTDKNLDWYLLHTEDGSKTWNLISNLSKSEMVPVFQSLKFINKSTGYYIGRLGFYQTLDGGVTWNKIIDGMDGDIWAYSFNTKNTVVLKNKGSKFTLIYISNASNTQISTRELPKDSFQTLVMNISESGDINFGPIKRAKTLTNDGEYVREYYPNLYLAHLSKSGDWSYTKLPEKSQQMHVSSKSMNFINDKVGFYSNPANEHGDFKGGFYRTIDGGKSWTLKHDFNKDSLRLTYMDFIDKNIGYASSGSALAQLYKTTDGGATWNTVMDGTKIRIGIDSLSLGDKTHLYFSSTAHPCGGGPKVYQLP